MRTILISSDHGGFALKEKLKVFLKKKGFFVRDLGTYCKERCDYPEFAYALGELISSGQHKRGISVCKSGIGNSIVLNRLRDVRAALCYSVKAARLSRQHNDSNVLILGSLFVKESQAKKIISVWLETKFQGGRHARRLNQIKRIERRCK
jgi:RpiB/LacA/LacB family sugar-phosphate isomerase